MSHEVPDDTLLDRLTRPSLPLDLFAVVGYVAVAVAVLSQSGVYGTPLAVAVGIPLLFFAPGYALVSLLFPGATPDDTSANQTIAPANQTISSANQTIASATQENASPRQHGLTGGERVALGFGLSVALLPILGIALAASPLSLAPGTVLLSVAGLAAGLAVLGAIRRLRRPADRRFSLPIQAWSGGARRAVSEGSAVDTALNIGLAAAVIVAVAAVGYAVAAPGPEPGYTNVSLLSQNETGKLVADDYPQNFQSGESRPLVVELTNEERSRTDYSVVVELQRVEQADDGGAKVLEDRTLATFTPAVESGETWQTTHEVTPTMTGEELRLVYLVYKGEPPEEPTTENAYRHVHVWITVSE